MDSELMLFATARHYTAADIPPGILANASSIINEHGIRLISQFEGPPRLKARLCEGGRFELGRGVTFHFDGRPVLEGETCDEEYAEALFVNALSVFAKAVDELVTVPINSNQRSALTALSYNIGIDNFRGSTVLKETNAGRFDDAAAAFGMWVFATKNGYKQALRGLARRQYATGCLFLSYDWVEACADEAIALQRQRPETLPGRDTVIYKTPFKDVLRVAQRYPLPPLPSKPEPIPVAVAPVPDSARAIPSDTPAAPAPEPVANAGTPGPDKPPAPMAPASPAPPIPAAPTSGPLAEPVGKAAAPKPAPVEAPPPVVAKVDPPKSPPPVVAGTDGAKPKSPNTVAPVEVPYRIDPNAGLKPLEESERAKGYVIQQVGISIIRLGSLGVFGTTVQAGAQTVQGDPVLSNMILIGFCAAGVALVGWVVATYGAWKKKRGEQKASQALF